MHRSFVLILEDEAGAFLRVARVLAAEGCDIKRASYNKVIDVHTLFLEAEGTPEALASAERRLHDLGVLPGQTVVGKVVPIEFTLRDQAGAFLPFLELIDRFGFSISYLNARAVDYHVGAALDKEGTEPEPRGTEVVRAGLYVDDPARLAVFIDLAQDICPTRQLPPDTDGSMIDNNLFYLSFAREMRRLLDLSERDEERVLVNANRLMQVLEHTSADPFKPFDYLGQFAQRIQRYRGDAWRKAVRVSRFVTAGGVQGTLIEPPCGSDTWVLECEGRLLCVDCGFDVYRQELLALLRELYPDWDARPHDLVLSHGDADHVGASALFDEAWASQNVIENFRRQRDGEPGWREEDPRGLPYVRLTSIFTRYEVPDVEHFRSLGARDPQSDRPIARCLDEAGSPVWLDVAPFHFEVWEGQGGHVRGETVLIDRSQRVCVSGDILIDVHGQTRPQSEFNRLAPYLLQHVDMQPDLARRERGYLLRLLDPGTWQILGGHGGLLTREVGPRQAAGEDDGATARKGAVR